MAIVRNIIPALYLGPCDSKLWPVLLRVWGQASADCPVHHRPLGPGCAEWSPVYLSNKVELFFKVTLQSTLWIHIFIYNIQRYMYQSHLNYIMLQDYREGCCQQFLVSLHYWDNMWNCPSFCSCNHVYSLQVVHIYRNIKILN